MPLPTKLKDMIPYVVNETSKKRVLALGDQAIVSATSFFTIVTLGRFCNKTELGFFALGMSIVLFLMCLQESIITLPYTVYSPRLKQEEQEFYNGSIILHQLSLSVVLIVIALSAISVAGFMKAGEHGLNKILYGVAVAMTPILLREYMRRIYIAQLRLSVVVRLDLTVSLVQVSVLLILSYIGVLTAVYACYAIGVACAVATMVWMAMYIRNCRFCFKRTADDFRRNWTFGKWVLAANVTSLVSSQLYLWFLALFHDAAATGIFAACQGVVFLSNPFLSGIRNMLGPEASNAYANNGKVNLRETLYRTGTVLGVTMGLFCVMLCLWGELLMVWLYGKQYAGYGNHVIILGLSALVSSVTVPFAYGLIAMERCDVNFKVDLISLLITVTLGVALVKWYGAIGVAYGLLLSNFVTLFVRGYMFGSCLKSAEPKLRL